MKSGGSLSTHILPTSATMVGVCMTVISIIKLTESGKGINVITDQLLAFDSVLFLLGSLFSYLSIRSKAKEVLWGRIADLIFMLGLLFMTIASFVLAYEIA